MPYIPNLLPQVDRWLRGVDPGEFYSLKGPRRRQRSKRRHRQMSAAVLAEKLEAALAVLPALSYRLDELTERQARLRRGGRTVQGNSSSPAIAQPAGDTSCAATCFSAATGSSNCRLPRQERRCFLRPPLAAKSPQRSRRQKSSLEGRAAWIPSVGLRNFLIWDFYV